MKKLIRLFAFFLAILLLAGCSGSGYRYVSKGEEAYISLRVQNVNVDESGTMSQVERPVVYFSSVEEMKEDIRIGQFSEKELYNIAQFEKNTEGKIIVPNIDTMPTPTYPVGFKVHQLAWYGGSDFPACWLKADGAWAEVTVLTTEKMAEELDSFFWNPHYGMNGIEKEETIPNANGGIAGIARYITDAAKEKRKMVHYTFTVDKATFYVREQYLLDSEEEVFYFMYIWCVDETNNSLVVLYGRGSDIIPFKLSIEEIAQFGFKKLSSEKDTASQAEIPLTISTE